MLAAGVFGLFTVADEIFDAAKLVGHLGDHADEVAETVTDVERSVVNNLDEMPTRTLDDMDELMGERRTFSEAETRAALGNSDRRTLSSRLNGSCNSFTAGTPVETEEGLKPIEEIKIGDKVLECGMNSALLNCPMFN